MKFGLTHEQYDYILANVVKPLQTLGATVWCYGSRARGDNRKFSDLDLMIESPKDLSTDISVIQEKLSKSNFPHKVDIVQFSEFADAYKDSYFQDRKLF